MLISSGVFYLLFADSELQPWNSGPVEGSREEKEVLSTEREMVAIVRPTSVNNETTVKSNGAKR